MSFHNGQERSAIDRDDLASALRALQPKRFKVEERFSSLMPQILEAIQRGVTQRDIVSALRDRGLPVSYPKFRKLLAASKQLAERSDV